MAKVVGFVLVLAGVGLAALALAPKKKIPKTCDNLTKFDFVIISPYDNKPVSADANDEITIKSDTPDTWRMHRVNGAFAVRNNRTKKYLVADASTNMMSVKGTDYKASEAVFLKNCMSQTSFSLQNKLTGKYVHGAPSTLRCEAAQPNEISFTTN